MGLTGVLARDRAGGRIQAPLHASASSLAFCEYVTAVPRSRAVMRIASLLLLSALTVLAAPPNVILIMADDFGYECVTANGGESYQTPVLDRLAAGGVRFENCHVQPRCTPCPFNTYYAAQHLSRAKHTRMR